MQQHKLLRQMSHSKFIGLYYVKVKGILPINDVYGLLHCFAIHIMPRHNFISLYHFPMPAYTFWLREFFDLYLILYNVFYIIFVYTKNWR